MKSVPESGSQSPSPGARNDSISQLIIIILLVVLILAVIAVVIVMNKKKSSYNVLFVVVLSGSFLLHSLTVAAADPIASSGEIVRAAWRERGCQYVEITGVGVSRKKKK